MLLSLLSLLYLLDLFSPFFSQKVEKKYLPFTQEEAITFSVLGTPFSDYELLEGEEEEILLWKAAENGFLPTYLLSQKKFKELEEKAKAYQEKYEETHKVTTSTRGVAHMALMMLLRKEWAAAPEKISSHFRPNRAVQQVQSPVYQQLNKSLELFEVKIKPEKALDDSQLRQLQEILLTVDMTKKDLKAVEKIFSEVLGGAVKLSCQPYILGKTRQIPLATFMQQPLAEHFNHETYKKGICSTIYQKNELFPSYNLYFLYVAAVLPTTPTMERKSKSDRLELINQREEKEKKLMRAKKMMNYFVMHYA